MSQLALIHSQSPLPTRLVSCLILRRKATVPEAHEEHSFGGKFPQEASQLPLDFENLEAPPYPPSAYKRYENRDMCDICGHKCLD